jgi:adenylosuccinate synthase
MTSNAVLVGDVGFGDGGKGVEVARQVKRLGATLVVRTGGGTNCGHNVVHTDFRHHTFRLHGSGTFEGAHTYLDTHVRFDPVMYVQEKYALQAKGLNPHLYVHPDCLVVTPLHVLHSHALATEHRRGTTGCGVGATARYAEEYPFDALCFHDLRDLKVTSEKMRLMAERLNIGEIDKYVVANMALNLSNIAYYEIEPSRYPSEVIPKHTAVVFEGHQGALLDCNLGFDPPHVTSSDTTFTRALELAKTFGLKYERVGVLRSYMTRHGAGAFPTESPVLTDRIREDHNRDEPEHLQGKWRNGWLDLELVWRGIWALGGVDYLVMSHVDKWFSGMKFMKRRDSKYLYRPLNNRDHAWDVFFDTAPTAEKYVGYIESELQHPINVIGHGKRAVDRTER